MPIYIFPAGRQKIDDRIENTTDASYTGSLNPLSGIIIHDRRESLLVVPVCSSLRIMPTLWNY
jgi:hypothetical protein